jgi:hypothetical protein
MDLDEHERLVSESESPIDWVTGEFKTSAINAEGKAARTAATVVPVDNAGGNLN